MIHGGIMRAGGHKSKGNTYENVLAKKLSLWLTHNIRSDVLERSPASGGKSTSARKRFQEAGHIAGDLIATCDEGYALINRFVIEAKHRNEEGINAGALVFATSKGGVIAFWLKLLEECAETKKLPMLIFKQNNRPDLIGLCEEGINLFELQTYPHALFNIGHKAMFLMLLSDFIGYADPDVLL